MPYSSNVFDSAVRALIKEWRYKRYLDIGCGAGKYARMIRSMLPDSYIEGIEIDKEYVTKFALDEVYDAVRCMPAEALIDGPQGEQYDLVVLGDVIEHMRKSDGINILHFLAYRCKRMIVVYPTKYVQYDSGGKKGESHRSVWSVQDFEQFSCDHSTCGYMNLASVRGYLDDSDAVFGGDE